MAEQSVKAAVEIDNPTCMVPGQGNMINGKPALLC